VSTHFVAGLAKNAPFRMVYLETPYHISKHSPKKPCSIDIASLAICRISFTLPKAYPARDSLRACTCFRHESNFVNQTVLLCFAHHGAVPFAPSFRLLLVPGMRLEYRL
jgi:hypothetical protein